MKSKRLEEYQKKRTFKETPEPAGRIRSSRGKPIFVVQKHHATHLHYDFRLEIHGVLASWAIPKAPSLNPADKRLAMMTENHPIEYAGFEGVIPEGQYGAGTMMVWDRGTYDIPNGLTTEEQLDRGEIKLTLHGKKLRGGFALIQIGKRSAKPTDKKRWLLIKHRDGYASPKWSITTRDLERSVLSGRTLKEIQAGRPAIRPKEEKKQTIRSRQRLPQPSQ